MALAVRSGDVAASVARVNLPSTTAEEIMMTEKQIGLEADEGRYYSFEEGKWVAVGCIERFVRNCLRLFIPTCFRRCLLGTYNESLRTSCARRTWLAIEKMPIVPKEISRRIRDLFLDALEHTNPAGAYCGSISRIFCKLHMKYAPELGQRAYQFDIQQRPGFKAFGIFFDGKLEFSVQNTKYGELELVREGSARVTRNSYDSLWDERGKRIASIKFDVDYRSNRRLPHTMQLYKQDDIPSLNIQETKEKTTLVFRTLLSNRVVAVANFAIREGLISWTITTLDKQDADKAGFSADLAAWAALKYSQHYHFQGWEYPRTSTPDLKQTLRLADRVL